MAEKKETKVKSIFETLNAIDLTKYIEKKGNLSYVSWAYAWIKVKENYPDATYKIYETPEGMIYHTDGRTAWVKTGVTINGIENIEYLPIMDNRNNSITIDRITSRIVNDSIQRSLTKACARHGLGLYIYAGEDLPEAVADEKEEQPAKQQPAHQQPVQQQPAQQDVKVGVQTPLPEDLKKEIAACATTEALMVVWNKYKPRYEENANFTGAMTARKDQILKNGKR